MRKTLVATKGHILTDGTVYGTIIHLAEGMDESAFYEITEEEYAAIMADNEPSEDDATEADYQSALEEMGVKL